MFAIDYLLSRRVPGVNSKIYQAIIPNFSPLASVQYTVAPSGLIYGYILYEWVFGQAMVPHSFDVKINQGGNKLFDAIISGRFITDSTHTFVFVTQAQPVDITVTNLRTLVNYYELTTFYLTIPSEDSFNIITDALLDCSYALLALICFILYQ